MLLVYSNMVKANCKLKSIPIGLSIMQSIEHKCFSKALFISFIYAKGVETIEQADTFMHAGS